VRGIFRDPEAQETKRREGGLLPLEAIRDLGTRAVPTPVYSVNDTAENKGNSLLIGANTTSKKQYNEKQGK
jgi:hypothetical protein